MSAQGHHGTDGYRRVDTAGNPEERPSRHNECVLRDTHVRDAAEWDVLVVHVPFSGNSSLPSSGPCSWLTGSDGARKKNGLGLEANSSCACRSWKLYELVCEAGPHSRFQL